MDSAHKEHSLSVRYLIHQLYTLLACCHQTTHLQPSQLVFYAQSTGTVISGRAFNPISTGPHAHMKKRSIHLVLFTTTQAHNHHQHTVLSLETVQTSKKLG